MRRSINKDEYPHQINAIQDQYGFKTLNDMAKETCSVEILKGLIEDYWDKDPSICKCVATNFATTEEMLRRLSKHPAEEVRVAVAINKKLDEKTSFKLVFDSSIQVRQALARNGKYKSVNKFLVQFNKMNQSVLTAFLSRADNSELILEFIKSENIDMINAFLANEFLDKKYLKAILELQLKNSKYHFIDKVVKHQNFTEELGDFVFQNFGLKHLNEEEFEAIKKISEM